MRQQDKFIFSAAVSVGVFLLPGPVSSAQISKTDGTTQTVMNDSFFSASPSQTDAALYSSNGSTINGTSLTIDDGGHGSGSNPVYAESGGNINLDGDTSVSGARGLHARGTGSHVNMTSGTIDVTRQAAAAYDGGQVTLDGVAISHHDTTSEAVFASNGTINLRGNTVLTSTGVGLKIQNTTGKIDADGVKVFSAASAAYNMQGTLKLQHFEFETTNASGYGVNANIGSTTNLADGSITTHGQNASGIWAAASGSWGGTAVTGDRLDIKTLGEDAHGVFAQGTNLLTAQVTLTDTHVETAAAFGLYADKGGKITLQNGSVLTRGEGATAVLTALQGASINLEGVDVKTLGDSALGLRTYLGSTMSMSNGTIETHGADGHAVFAGYGSGITLQDVNATTYGANSGLLVMLGNTNQVNTIDVAGGEFLAADASAIYARGANNTLTLTNTAVSGNGTLLDVARRVVETPTPAVHPTTLTMQADASRLVGGARVDSVSQSNVELRNGTQWTLTQAADGSAESAVSNLTVDHSTVAFAQPGAGLFQTLTVGSGNPGGPAQYVANGATLQMNTWLNEGGALSNQQTDRLLINGDVTGTTQVQVNGLTGSRGGMTSPDGSKRADEGISLIQVAGQATASSFRLKGDYVALKGMPYQYKLYAYGPGSENGDAAGDQRLVAGVSSYWDYRLQSAFTGEGVREVAPQVPVYLVAPTALFDAGLQDISNLHSRLGEIRHADLLGGGTETGEFFMRAYGGKHDYSSNRSMADYGYDADINYAAAQVGGNLFDIRNASGVTRFGIAGSFGSLSYNPKHVEGAGSGNFHTWSVGAYATYQHAGGGYVDGIVSVGAFDGDVSTRLRGRTAGLKGTSFAASLEAGYPIALGGDFVLEPQAQLVYQRLQFDRELDVDGFVVDLGHPDQLTGRLGARLSRSFTADSDLITVYAQADVLHGLSSGGTVSLGDRFQLGRSGTALEGRLGVDAKTTNRLSFYADVAYRHELGNNGTRGLSLNGGARYLF